MRSIFILATLAMLAALASAAKSNIRGGVYCIASDSARTICTNHCAIGKTCTATCKGGTSAQVTINSRTGKASWTQGSTPHGMHIIQDQWPCSHWVVENHVSSKQMCPKSIRYWPVKECMDVGSGASRNPGYVGVI